MDRRVNQRFPVDMFLNKYIDGMPYACRGIDISSDGVRIVSLQEPASRDASFPIQIGLAGWQEQVWVWAQTAWHHDGVQALRFVHIDERDRAALNRLIALATN